MNWKLVMAYKTPFAFSIALTWTCITCCLGMVAPAYAFEAPVVAQRNKPAAQDTRKRPAKRPTDGLERSSPEASHDLFLLIKKATAKKTKR